GRSSSNRRTIAPSPGSPSSTCSRSLANLPLPSRQPCRSSAALELRRCSVAVCRLRLDLLAARPGSVDCWAKPGGSGLLAGGAAWCAGVRSAVRDGGLDGGVGGFPSLAAVSGEG